MRNNRNGITVTSITVYIMLFFMFTTVTTIISSRFNDNLFKDRGTAINITAINKLEYNLLKSADESYDVEISKDENKTTITFSNFDKYVFDNENDIILKNGGKLVEFVTNVAVNIENKIINIDITVNKYTNKLQRNIRINIPLMES